MARTHRPSTRLKGSAGDSLRLGPAAMPRVSVQRHVDGALGQLLAHTALEEFRHQRPLELVAFVDEGDAEGKADIAEDLRVLGPGQHGAWAHDRGEVAIDEG